MRKKSDNTITIFQTGKKAKLVTLPKLKVENDLGWITGDKLEYHIVDGGLMLRKKAK